MHFGGNLKGQPLYTGGCNDKFGVLCRSCSLWHESNADTDQKIKAQSKLNSFNWEKNNQKRINMAQHYIPFSTDSRYNT